MRGSGFYIESMFKEEKMTYYRDDKVDIKSRSAYKTLLFDFDGTLVDTIPQILDSFQYVYMEITGDRVSEDEILETIGQPLENSFDKLDETLRAKAIDLYIEHNISRLANGVGIFLGIKPMLEELKSKNINIGIVTSKRMKSAKVTATQFEIYQLFDVFITKDDTLRHKPYSDPIEKAIEVLNNTKDIRHKVCKETTLFIGDSIHDLECARNAGIDIAIVDWTRMDKNKMKQAKPDYWIYKTADLINLC